MAAAGLKLAPPMPADKPHWGVSFAVDDVDAAVNTAAALGGKVCVAPCDLPGVGRFSLLESPGGVAFHVLRFG